LVIRETFTMKIQLLFTLIICYFSVHSYAQPTWSEDVAEIFYNNCTECHNAGGVAPFSLIEYEPAYTYRALIKAYVEANIMPPWKADTSFQHYFDERILTTFERETIIDWANADAPEGDPTLAPAPPVYTGEQQLPGVPDLSITMPNYMSKATETHDDYICISLPTGVLEDRRVKAIEIIPGNRSIVHHCLVYNDPEGTYETDTIGGDCGGPTGDVLLMAGYTPGASPTIFPSSDDFAAGMVLRPESNVVFAMHYPHGSYGFYDQTTVNFYFYNEPVADFREIIAAPVLSNWEFILPPDEITSVNASYEDVPVDISVLSTFPHMHLLGKSIESYALTPDEDTIPFVRIPHWDFDWQDFYWFRYMQVLPAGSDLYAHATFDNTEGNVHNPHDPPELVLPGFNTTDEMFLVYFHLMAYEEGDEFVNVDSLNTVYLSNQYQQLPPQNTDITVFPNPTSNEVTISFDLLEQSFVSLFVYDLNGRVVQKLWHDNRSAGPQNIVWNGNNTTGQKAPAGVYFYSMLIDGKPYNGQIVKL
jgi:hypothetical protein